MNDRALVAPDTLTEGWTTLHLVNEGDEPHMAMLVLLDDERSTEEFIEVYSEAVRTDGPRPEWAERVGGPGAADPGGALSVTQYLEPGRYVVLDIMDLGDGVPNFMQERGLARSIVVEAATDAASAAAAKVQGAPEADAEVRLVDYAFGIEAPLTVGRQTIRAYNTGTQPHELGLMRLIPGSTIHDVLAWLENPQGPPPITGIEGGVASFAPDREVFLNVDLEAGDYALLCFVTAPDGRSHLAHGMYQQIRVE